MELFKTLSEMLSNGSTVTISISKKGDDLTVSVLPGNSIVKDAAKSHIVPLNLSGSAQELDEGFVEAIKAPIAKASGLLSDMASFEKAAELAKEKSKMEAERKSIEDKRKKDLAEWIALAKKNLEEKKFRDALTCVGSARKIATENELAQLTALEGEIASSSGAGSMFGEDEDFSDGKNVKINVKSAKGNDKS
jgi:PRTRC genetic system protein E